MKRPLISSIFAVALLAVALLAISAGAARATERATVELQLIWGSDDAAPPDPNLKAVDPDVEKILKSSPYRWKHYYLVNRRIEEINSDQSKNKIPMSSHCALDIKYLGKDRVQVKLYGDTKLLSKNNEATPLLLAGDAKNDTAWLVLIRMAQPAPAAKK